MRKKDERFLELMKLDKNNVVLYKDKWCVIFPKKFSCLNNEGRKMPFDMIQIIGGKLVLLDSDESTIGSGEAGYMKWSEIAQLIYGKEFKKAKNEAK